MTAKPLSDRLPPRLYDELRDLASRFLRNERGDHTWSATDLVHELYGRLIGELRSASRALVATTMRRLLVDHARARGRDKRGGGQRPLTLTVVENADATTEIDVLDLDAALDELQQIVPRQAQIVELKFFGGLTTEEIAHTLGISRRSVAGDWAMARIWLERRLR